MSTSVICCQVDFRTLDSGFPFEVIPPDTMADSKYLSKYGYADDEKSKTDPKEPERALKMFQEANNIEPTGKLNDDTTFAMKQPRCCHKDVPKKKGKRPKPHDLNLEDVAWPTRCLDLYEQDKWEKKRLTWRVTKFSSQEMPKELVNESLRRAFYIWEKHADITFAWQEDGIPDLEIRWEVGDHGDGDPFDGSGGTLAHAFFPQVCSESPIFKCPIKCSLSLRATASLVTCTLTTKRSGLWELVQSE